ncbi:MAG TPA: 6-pyruvoyl-tetrahydropterin synthase-related protein [Patescibacteria group bacterium]
MLQLKGSKLTIFILILLGLLILPSLLPLIHSGFFLSDDGNWMVIRFSAFYEAIRQGQFPPRFLVRLNHGYGYPVADFLYPLFMYIGLPIKLLGMNFVNTVKIIFGLSIIFSGIFTFFWLRKSVGKLAAFIGAFVYVLFPYHMFDVYQRGSIGEVLALAIVPLALWQIERKNLIYTSLSIALLILSHNSLAVLFLPIILIYIVYRKIFSFKEIGLILLLSLSFGAFFWIPALYDKQFTIFDKTPVSDISTYFISIFSSLIGWITGLIIVFSLIFLRKKSQLSVKFFLALSIISVFFVLPISYPIWKLTHIIPFFQFPYRFLSLTVLGISFLSGVTVELMPKKFKIFIVIAIVSVTYLSSWSYIFPKSYQYFPDTFYSTNQDSTTVKNEYMPIWVKDFPTSYTDQKIKIITGDGVINDVAFNGSNIESSVINNTKTITQLNIIYFPGWEVKVDGQRVNIFYENSSGLIQFPVDTGGHTISARFTETPIRLFADIISIISIAGLIFFVVKKRYEK